MSLKMLFWLISYRFEWHRKNYFLILRGLGVKNWQKTEKRLKIAKVINSMGGFWAGGGDFLFIFCKGNHFSEFSLNRVIIVRDINYRVWMTISDTMIFYLFLECINFTKKSCGNNFKLFKKIINSCFFELKKCP